MLRRKTPQLIQQPALTLRKRLAAPHQTRYLPDVAWRGWRRRIQFHGALSAADGSQGLVALSSWACVAGAHARRARARLYRWWRTG